MSQRPYHRYTPDFKEKALGLLSLGKPVAEVRGPAGERVGGEPGQHRQGPAPGTGERRCHQLGPHRPARCQVEHRPVARFQDRMVSC